MGIVQPSQSTIVPTLNPPYPQAWTPKVNGTLLNCSFKKQNPSLRKRKKTKVKAVVTWGHTTPGALMLKMEHFVKLCAAKIACSYGFNSVVL